MSGVAGARGYPGVSASCDVSACSALMLMEETERRRMRREHRRKMRKKERKERRSL